jgi:electron transfer flavoprotein alpha subunit
MSVHQYEPGLGGELLVFVDLPEGELDDCGKGMLSETARLAGKLGAPWSVPTFAGGKAEALAEMGRYGVDRITQIDGPANCADSFEVQGRQLAAALRDIGAASLLLAHTDLGEALAPLLAAELEAALFTEAIATSRDGDLLNVSRQVLGDRVAESWTWDGSCKLVLSVNPRILSAAVLPSMQPGRARVASWQPQGAVVAGGTRIVERIPPDPQTVDVSEAEVMISAGLGCDTKGFAQVEELCRLLNASLGVTRPAYDLGYTDFERMVGQTGKTVAPCFYLALGISGSMHHLGGIKDSKKVVSVNLDSKAPIFANSDEGFVADLREVLPLLIERVKSATGGSA